MRPLLSICIPSFNRPKQMSQLLESIDCEPRRVEIVVCEDKAPRRSEVRAAVEAFVRKTTYTVRYLENDQNLGFDGNLRRLVEVARGEYVMFMGDDDLFVTGALDRFIAFIVDHRGTKYFLRSYNVVHEDGTTERFRYLPASTALPPGEQTVAWLFKRSVTICGFTISRDDAAQVATSDLDGTLLYQVYLMSEVCLDHPSIYCDIPIVQAVQSYRQDKPEFGTAATERGRYTPGIISQDNSISFTKAYFDVTDYIDKLHGTHLTARVRTILSRFAYPFLSIQRKHGVRPFLRYAKRLEIECGLACTPYFHIYKWGLALLGERTCDRIIVRIKATLGHTPSLGARPTRALLAAR